MNREDSIKKNQSLAPSAAQNLHQDKPILKLDWCSYKAAKHAVEHWHYSKRMPVGKSIKIGVWENGLFIGVVIFSQGNNLHIGNAYGLGLFDVCELTRIALTTHLNPVSKIVSIAMKFLKISSPGLKLIVSYADPEHGHNGSIYQAMNWIYVGLSASSLVYELKGKRIHSRVANPGNIQFGRPAKRPIGIENAIKIRTARKYKYLYPLDEVVKQKIKSLRKPYPKRATSETVDTPVHQTGKRGSTPTVALQSSLQVASISS